MDLHQFIHIHWSIFVMINIHDNVAEPAELGSPQRFGEEITNHLVRGAVFEINLATALHVGDEKIPDIHVASPFAAGSSAIRF